MPPIRAVLPVLPRPLRRATAAALGVALLLAASVVLWGRPATGQSTVTRLDAGTAVEAGIAVSRHAFGDGSTRHVVLVRDDAFADGLVAGPLSGELPDLAPLLFTPTEALDERVAAEIDRVTGGSGTVHIIGGTAAIGPGVADELVAAGHAVQRVSGATRIETAQAVFDTFFADDLAGRDVVLARAFGSTPDEGDAWPDAITGGGYGAARGTPVLLTPTGGLPDAVATQIRDAGAGAAILLGGTDAIGDQVAADLDGVVEEVVRAAGSTREGTAVAVATDLYGITALEAADVVVVVNGRTSFAFGLAASALAARGEGSGESPVLLVTADSPTSGCDPGGETATPTACYLQAEGTQAGAVLIVGDTDQVSAAVETALAGLRGGGSGPDAGLGLPAAP
jgi:putative cell wall-binding protein